MIFNISCKELAEKLNLQAKGNLDLIIENVNRVALASGNDLTFLSSEEYLHHLNDLKNCAIISFPQLSDKVDSSCCFIASENPHSSFVKALRLIEQQYNKRESGIHPKAIISEGCSIDETAFVGASAFIGKNCKIEAGVNIMPNAVLYNNIEVGKNTVINSNVTIYDDCKIGANCIIHAGAVIGADGFGFEEDKNTGAFYKIPQLGNVIIEDDVEIGANSTIDCAIAGSTILRKGVKIDNLVHVAHNCIIGENTALAGQTGVSGSSNIGARNRFGGQVGIAGHLDTADDVIIIAQGFSLFP